MFWDLEIWDNIIYSPNLIGSGQVCSLALRNRDTEVTAHSWDRFIFVSGHSFPALLALILTQPLSETKIPATS